MLILYVEALHISSLLCFVCYLCSRVELDCVIQIPWQSGTEVVTLYKFPGNSAEDLPFKRGEILTIIHACAVRTTIIVVAGLQLAAQHNIDFTCRTCRLVIVISH